MAFSPPSNDDLVDRALIRTWLGWGFVWLLIFPTIGALVSTKFNAPDFLGGVAWLSFGRLRPLHVNGVIWGAFSTLFIGLCHWIVPRLCGVRLAGARWSRPLLLGAFQGAALGLLLALSPRVLYGAVDTVAVLALVFAYLAGEERAAWRPSP